MKKTVCKVEAFVNTHKVDSSRVWRSHENCFSTVFQHRFFNTALTLGAMPCWCGLTSPKQLSMAYILPRWYDSAHAWNHITRTEWRPCRCIRSWPHHGAGERVYSSCLDSFFAKIFFFGIVSQVNWKTKKANKQNIFTEWCCPWKWWCWKHLPQNGCDTFEGDKRDLTQQDGNSATEWRKNILHSRSCATFFRHSAVLILLAVLLCSHCACSSGDDVRPPCFEPLLHKYSRGLDRVLTHIREDLLQMQPVKSFIVYIFQAKIKPDRVYRLNEFIDPHAI